MKSILCAVLLFFCAGAIFAAPAPRMYLDGLKPFGALAENDFAPRADLAGSRGETLIFAVEWEIDRCRRLELSPWRDRNNLAPRVPFAVRFYEELPFKTLFASYNGAPVGIHRDPLWPVTEICPEGGEGRREKKWLLAEIGIPSELPPSKYRAELGGLPVEVEVWPMVMPRRPTLPLYSCLVTWFALLGHHGKWAPGEEELGAKYARAMVADRVYPLSHWVRGIELNADGSLSQEVFEKSVLATSPPDSLIGFPLAPDGYDEAKQRRYYAALEKNIRERGLEKRAIIYAWDEPRAEDLPKLVGLLKTIKQSAPSLRTFVTTLPRPELDPWVDFYVPVLDQFSHKASGHQNWVYVSCMSHGCTNGNQSGTPDFMIDRPSVHIRAFAWVAMQLGLDGVFYYSVDNAFQRFAQGRDPWVDLWDFTGNGDGTLFYPGRKGLRGLPEEAPIESVRLKDWKQASYDAEYIQWMNSAPRKPDWWESEMRKLARDGRNWSREYRSFQQTRNRMGHYFSDLSKH